MGKIIMSPVSDLSLGVTAGQYSLGFNGVGSLAKSPEGNGVIVIEGVGGSTTLSSLTDVNLNGLQNGQVLSFSGSSWINTPAGGTGDMLKSTYDTNNSGVVDDSEKLNNQLASYYLNRDNHTGTQSINTIQNLQTTLNNKEDLSNKDQPDGYSSLNNLGKIPASNLDLTAYMLKSFYDVNSDGVVNNSDQVGGYSASYLLNRTNHTGSQAISTITNLQLTLDGKESIVYKGTANGYCDLNSFGKVPAERLDLSAITYKNSWNATTNTPSLSDNMVGATAGDAYIVGVAGTHNFGSGNITFVIGDLVVYGSNGIWQKVDGVGVGVSSVNGDTGAVTININDISPLTTKGDLIVHNGFTSSRIGVGTNGQIIVADSTAPNGLKWENKKFETVISYDTTTQVEDYYSGTVSVTSVTKSPGLNTWEVKIGAGVFSTPTLPFTISPLTEVVWKITYNTGKTKGVLIIGGEIA